MKHLLFALLLLAVVPVFADNISFVYYGYDYDPGYYDEYWYNDYWYDGYWVYMPYGYYCVRFVWWYPWWWDWYWARCHWCHHFQWDFFYAGFYVVWYDHGTWWYRPRYGHYVRYRLPHSYATLRVRARTQGIYLPEKPPREVELPYRENTVMQLAKQNDPGLFARVERENRTGNLERMRTKYVNQINDEIAVKNREHGIESRRIDINELAKRERSIAWTSNENPIRLKQKQSDSDNRSPNTRIEQPSKKNSADQGTSRIRTESKSETKNRPSSSRDSAGREQRTESNDKRVPPTQVQRPQNRSEDGPRVVERERGNEKTEKQPSVERKSTPQSQRQSGRKPNEPRNPAYNRSDVPEGKR